MSDETGTVWVSVAEAREAGCAALRALGAAEPVARLVTDRLIAAELEGYPAHGLMRIAEYRRAVRGGHLVPDATPVTERLGATTFAVDGRHAFGALVADEVVATAATPADGALLIGVRDSGHLGRLAHIGQGVAAAGRVVLGFVNSRGGAQKVAPHGGAAARLATNPILLACPSPRGAPPVVVDVTTSATSDGAMRMAAAEGHQVRDGLLVGSSGEWVHDPSRLNENPRTAFLAPLGSDVAGHKGFALAVAVEILAGIIGGGSFASPGNTAMGNAGLFVVFDVDMLGQSTESVLESVGMLTKHLVGCPPQPGRTVRMPGSKQLLSRPALAVPRTVWRHLRRIAADPNIDQYI